jgi:phospholipid/cholesterol/gamma-HCH transport system substrate-binding protein
MIHINRQAKTGIIVVIATFLFIWGFNYLKGKDILKSYNTYYAILDNVEGIVKSTPITLKGIAIGNVEDLHFTPDMTKTVMVLNIDQHYNFSKDSKVKVYGGNIMGGKSVAIVPGKSNEMMKDGDTLEVMKMPGMFDLVNDKITPLQNKLESSLISLDSILKGVNNILDEPSQKNIKESLADLAVTLKHFKNTSKQIDQVVNQNKENINLSIKNFHKISEDFSVLSDSLKQIKIGKISNELEQSITGLNQTLKNLNNEEGTTGKLMKDKELYDNLTKATKELELLLKDLREHPKKYVHFSIFGKKDKYQKETD